MLEEKDEHIKVFRTQVCESQGEYPSAVMCLICSHIIGAFFCPVILAQMHGIHCYDVV